MQLSLTQINKRSWEWIEWQIKKLVIKNYFRCRNLFIKYLVIIFSFTNYTYQSYIELTYSWCSKPSSKPISKPSREAGRPLSFLQTPAGPILPGRDAAGNSPRNQPGNSSEMAGRHLPAGFRSKLHETANDLLANVVKRWIRQCFNYKADLKMEFETKARSSVRSSFIDLWSGV
jgi:hypothetical protein